MLRYIDFIEEKPVIDTSSNLLPGCEEEEEDWQDTIGANGWMAGWLGAWPQTLGWERERNELKQESYGSSKSC